MTDFAQRAEAIRREMLAIDLGRSPQVALVVVVEDGSAHRHPIDIDVPDAAFALKEFERVATDQSRDQFRRGVQMAVLRAGANLIARAVANLPKTGVRFVDARLEVIYP